MSQMFVLSPLRLRPAAVRLYYNDADVSICVCLPQQPLCVYVCMYVCVCVFVCVCVLV